jgi:UDP-N-acetylmuramyl pentapeptide synthase
VHEALRELGDVVRPGDAVLVKASRAMGLEAIASALIKVPA